MKAAPLYERPTSRRAKRLKVPNMSTGALVALCELLERAGWPTSLVIVRTWPRLIQGESYLWALAVLDGSAGTAPPPWYALRRKGLR